LLCITCMFIASKYEKICAPRVEEWCFMTDDKYTKQEVVKMEIEVLNLLRFHVMCSYNQNISQEIHPSSIILLQGSSLHWTRIPGKLFSRAYSCRIQILIVSTFSCGCFCCIPCQIDSNHLEHPWTPTLENHTNYRASELKTVVLALEDLQLNTKGCSLHAIREKYKQDKFNCVVKLSPKPVQSLFQVQV
jgi:cyclin A